MNIAVPKEVAPGERRVALVPESVRKLIKAGFQVLVETGAGAASSFGDESYGSAGARVMAELAPLYGEAQIILKVQPPTAHPVAGQHEAGLMRAGTILVGALQPLSNLDTVRRLAEARVTSFSSDLFPRITREQKMDTLSSMSTIAGYKAVLLAANALGKLFPMMMTAAGTVKPAKVFVIGAGVAGLQAISTARRLGAVVEAFDVRPAAQEQIRSLGATALQVQAPAENAETKGGYAKEMSKDFLAKQAELTQERCKASDVVITTALIFGKRAPTLITEEMVKGMRPGAVIVDLAAEQGGNCALTEPGKTVVKYGVTIIGETNIPSLMAEESSQMFSRNLTSFILEYTKDGAFQIDLNDEILKGSLMTHEGKIVHDMVRTAAGA